MNTYSTFAKVTSEIKTHNFTTGQCTTFTIADSTRQRVNGKMDWATMFVDCIAFGKVSEFIQKSTKKGDHVFICGELCVQEYQTKDGLTRYRSKLTVDRFKVSKEEISLDRGNDLPDSVLDPDLSDDLPSDF